MCVCRPYFELKAKMNQQMEVLHCYCFIANYKNNFEPSVLKKLNFTGQLISDFADVNLNLI